MTWRISNTNVKDFESASSAEPVLVNQHFLEEYSALMTKKSVKHSAAERAGVEEA